MKAAWRLLFKILGVAAVVLLVIAGIVAPASSPPTSTAAACRPRSSARSGRHVEIGKVHFSLFKGPGFSVDKRHHLRGPGDRHRAGGLHRGARLHGSGAEHLVAAGRQVRDRLHPAGRAPASISPRSGPAAEWGRWNFASFINPSVMRTAPAIHVRNSRIHFKFGDTKTVFYLTETDLDISPPAPAAIGRSPVPAKPARTDRPAQGLGSFTLKGRWYADPERVDLDMDVDRTAWARSRRLLSGQDAGVHGTSQFAPAPGRPAQQHRESPAAWISATCTAGT